MRWAVIFLALCITAGSVGCWRPYYGQTYAPPAYQQAAPVYGPAPPVYQQQPAYQQPPAVYQQAPVMQQCQPVYQPACTPCY